MSFILEELVRNKYLQILISVLISLIITYWAMPIIRNVCIERNLMENPIKRSSHSSPTPTFGGVGIFAGTVIGYMIWNFEDEGVLLHKVFAGLVILFFIGIKDDIFALAPLKKLTVQILVASIIVIGSDLRITSLFGTFGVHSIPYFVSVLFTIILFVAIINAFNLIDGIDGLAAGIGMISSALFGLWFISNGYWSMSCLAFSLSASLLSFLRFNFSKTSKIFMGDTGSLIVGYLVSILAVKFVQVNELSFFGSVGDHFVSAPVLAIVVLCVPIFDTLRVFGLRIMKGKSPFNADRLHLHHLLVDNGLNHFATSAVLWAFTIILTVFTYYLRTFFSNTALSIYVLSVFAIYLLVSSYLELRRYNLKKNQKTGNTDILPSTSNAVDLN